MNRLLAGLVALFLLTLSSVAAANSGGLAGYTGKPNASNPNGQSCNGCHTGGAAPTVTLNGPASMAAGSMAEFTLNVTGNGATAGGVAATDGVKLTAGSGFRDSFGEMVQSAPQGGSGVFKFTVTAPASGGTIKLWAVGLGGSSQTSSSSRAITKDITVTGGSGTPSNPGNPSNPGDPGTPGAGDDDDGENGATPGSGSSDGNSSSKKTKKSSEDGDDDDDDEEEDDDYRDRRSQFNDAQACSTTHGPGSRVALSGLAIALAGLMVRRKKK